jgi:hypothetical protein
MNADADHAAALAAQTDPDAPMTTFSVEAVLTEMQAAAEDAQWFLAQMQRNEETRLCVWEGKTGTGRKQGRAGVPAEPWEGAPDHESHLTQEVINRRNAMRVAALARGSLSVSPTENGDNARAANMRTVLRYNLNGPMKSQVLVHGLRAGSWADRWGHSLMYIGWQEDRGLEPMRMTADQMANLLMDAAIQPMDDSGSGMRVEGKSLEESIMEMLLPEMEVDTAQRLALLIPGLASRKLEGVKQARKALRFLRSNPGKEATMHGMFVRRSAPVWEALIPYVDVFYPAETNFEDNLDSTRWIARVKWMSEQQILERAAVDEWDSKWVTEVLKHKGHSVSLAVGKHSWALSGAGVRWSALHTAGSRNRTGGESQKHLYQIIELWDRSMSSDGLTGTYYTVLHADVKDMVAVRKLREDWHGCLPFVAFTCEKDERMLLASRSVAEITSTPQQAIKTQWDSRSAAASLTTLPPWTGPPELQGQRPAPNKYMMQSRPGVVVQPWTMPAPDGRSIEIEGALRDSMDRYFGLQSKAVPDAVAMAMGQADMDWYLAGISQAVKLTAQLVQQHTPPLKNARIAGTDEVFSATADEVRGAFDFMIKFDVRALDLEWAGSMLGFVKDMLLPLDRRGDIDSYPLLELGFNLLDGSLTPRCLPGQQTMMHRQEDEEHSIIADIFSGGTAGWEVRAGINHQGRAQVMVDDLVRSPERQRVLLSSPQVFVIFTARLEGLLNNDQQNNENVITGQTLTQDPMKQQSQAERLLAFLKGLGFDIQTDPAEMQQALPFLQQFLQQL